MKHYLVDGYNLIYSFSSLPTGTWEAKRTALLTWLHKERPQGQNLTTVVFDSRQGSGNRMKVGELEVVYPSQGTADDWIISEVRTAKNPRMIVVVSNDKGIRDMIRGTGARWLPATEFRVIKKQKSAPEADLSPFEDITKELKDRWL